jgi:F0F1-type ATP synthase delta subunit
MENIDPTDFFSTRSQATDFMARLSMVAENIYELDFDLEKNLQEQFGVDKKDKFLSLLRKNKVPMDSNSELNNFFEKIQELVSELPAANITLAIEPDNKTLKNISNWFLLKIKKQVLLDIKVDPKIIAGALVGFQGKQIDGSISSTFNKVSSNILNINNQNS